MASNRSTQTIDRAQVMSEIAAASVSKVWQALEDGEEPRKIFSRIVDCAKTLEGVQGTAVYLPKNDESDKPVLSAHSGNFPLSHIYNDPAIPELYLGNPDQPATERSSIVYFDIMHSGKAIGAITIVSPEGVPMPSLKNMENLALCASAAFRVQAGYAQLNTLSNRLDVLNDLHQLIAKNVGKQQLAKNLARLGAFQFNSDVCIVLSESDDHSLEPIASHGCSMSVLPTKLTAHVDLIIKAQRIGGHLATEVDPDEPFEGLEFLSPLGIKKIEIAPLEVGKDSLGLILMGHQRVHKEDPVYIAQFEEYCRGAAVAMASIKSQERLTAYTDSLEELVERRTEDLQVQSERAEEANRAKSEFLANMSHELRTPLTAIVGYASILTSGVYGEMNTKQHDAINAIARSSEHLKGLIDDVLNLARVESGKEVAEPKKVTLFEPIENMYKIIMQSALQKGVKLRALNISDDLKAVKVFVDPKHIRQILMNIMSNAVKYTPKDGEVWIEVSRMRENIRVSICDTGIGISEDKLQKLFERFERGEDGYTKDQEGSGLGLNLTRLLATLNNGFVGVQSTEGKGSTFWIDIPTFNQDKATDVVETPPLAQLSMQQIDLKGVSAIVVDDNADSRELLKQILEGAGAKVRAAENVQNCLEELATDPPSIILTDLAMPGLSGLDLINTVRAKKEQIKDLPILVLSACAFKRDREAVLEAGANSFIPKPYTPEVVMNKVWDLVSKKKVDKHIEKVNNVDTANEKSGTARIELE